MKEQLRSTEAQPGDNGSKTFASPSRPSTEAPQAVAPDATKATNGSATRDGFNTDNNHTSGKLNLDSVRLSQKFGALSGVKKLLTTVPARKPNRQEFFRVKDDPAYRMSAAVLELKEERETYLLAASVCHAMPGEWVPRELVTTINRQGVVFIWPVPLPAEDGRSNSWHDAAREAAQLAQKHWIRMAANMSLGAYEIYEATGELSDPHWPSEDFQTLLSIAYRDRFITDLDHPVLRRLRGEL